MSEKELIKDILDSVDLDSHHLNDDTAHLVIHGNQVVASHTLDGLVVDVDSTENGIQAQINLKAGTVITNPVHMCFGLIPEDGIQAIDIQVNTHEESAMSIVAHCTFPNAVNVEHRMNAELTIGPGSRYSYFERHVHGDGGGVLVVPKARVTVCEHAEFKTEFELIKGRVGRMDIDYETEVLEQGVMEMVARVSGREDDTIKLTETGRLSGTGARGVLTSHIALRESARAEIYNTLTASAPFARGHVDCKEIVQDQAVARAVPIVEVTDPRAHVTHEAAIGSVDGKQLETLMSRGLNEDQAADLIIEGLLS